MAVLVVLESTQLVLFGTESENALGLKRLFPLLRRAKALVFQNSTHTFATPPYCRDTIIVV